MTAVQVKQETPVDVTWEDQQRICIFSRLYSRIRYLQSRTKMLSDDLEKLDDAENEVMICDNVKYVIGEAFVDLDADTTLEYLIKQKEAITDEKSAIDDELTEVNAALEQLKGELYAKFGSQIHLEDDEEATVFPQKNNTCNT